MLASIGVVSVEALFDEILLGLRSTGPTGMPEGLSEMAVSRLMQSCAAQDGFGTNFIGAGAYEHPRCHLADHHLRRVLFRLHKG